MNILPSEIPDRVSRVPAQRNPRPGSESSASAGLAALLESYILVWHPHRGIEPDVVDSCHMPPKKMMVRVAWIPAAFCPLPLFSPPVEFPRFGSTNPAPNPGNWGAIHGTLAAVRVRELD